MRRGAALAVTGAALFAPRIARANDAASVGVLPITAVAPIYLGIKRGYFSAESLDVTPQVLQGGAAIVPAVLRGDLTFGFSNVVSLLLASSRGLALRAVATGAMSSRVATSDATAVIVRADAPIKSAADLEGKTLGLDSLGNIGDLTIRAALDKRSVDISKIRFVELPFPDMLGALDAGRLDAAYVSDPFLTIGKDRRMRVLFYPYYEAVPSGFAVTMYFTSRETAEKNPGLVARFRRAVERSLELAHHDPAAARAVILEYTKIAPDVVQRMTLPDWDGRLRPDAVAQIASLMERYGFVHGKLDISALGLDAST